MDAFSDAAGFREFERAGHDRVADGVYAEFFAPLTAGAIDALLDAAGVTTGARVLDVAAGPGFVAGRASGRGAAVVGIDLSPRMVALALRLHPGLDFREADVERLPFPSGRFDAVVGNFGIGHFPRPEAAVAELVRVLVAGGRLALTWWDFAARARVNGVFFDAIGKVGATAPPDHPVGPPPFRFSADAEFAGLLRGAGLEAVEVRRHAFVHRLASADQWWNGGIGSMVRASAVIRGQPPDTQRQIRAVFDTLVEEYAVPGGFDVPVSVKIAAGRKPGA